MRILAPIQVLIEIAQESKKGYRIINFLNTRVKKGVEKVARNVTNTENESEW